MKEEEVIKIMDSIGFALLKDGETFYKQGYELNPRINVIFTMNQAFYVAIAIEKAISQTRLDTISEIEGLVEKQINKLLSTKTESEKLQIKIDVWAGIDSLKEFQEQLKQMRDE